MMARNDDHHARPADRRCAGDRGSSMVAALVLLFAFTAGGVIWLARDVDRAVSNRSAAQSIAFQAARSGAQQVVVDGLRDGDLEVITIDLERANIEARRTAERLFDQYQLDGSVTAVRSDGPERVIVEVLVRDSAGDVTGVGSAEAQSSLG